jgi:hypothetical protein
VGIGDLFVYCLADSGELYSSQGSDIIDYPRSCLLFDLGCRPKEFVGSLSKLMGIDRIINGYGQGPLNEHFRGRRRKLGLEYTYYHQLDLLGKTDQWVLSVGLEGILAVVQQALVFTYVGNLTSDLGSRLVIQDDLGILYPVLTRMSNKEINFNT